jgi:hypothetical protein
MRLFRLLFAVPFFTAAASPLAAQSSWDRYRPGTLTAIAEHVQENLVHGVDTTSIGFVLAESDYPTRARVEYRGSWRPISAEAREVISAFISATGLDSQVVAYFRSEALIAEEGRELWIPVQQSMVPRLREMEPGAAVTLFVMWVGASQYGSRLQSVFIVNNVIASGFIREIELGSFGKVVLGAELVQRDRILGDREGALHHLRAGTFGGAESLAVELDERHRVRAMHFGYEAGSSFDLYAASYTQLLGEPVARTRTATTEGEVVTLHWRDDETEHELVNTVSRGVSRVTLRLIDRKLSGR